MVRRLLVVCTANVCRSAVAERLVAKRLAGCRDVDGETWVVRSAGTADLLVAMDRNTIGAADAVGLDLRDHRARHLDRGIIAEDGADLILTMTREHLRHVVALEPSAWPRTFTLKELARRGGSVGPPSQENGGFQAWIERLGVDRRAAELIKADPQDDVADPYGAPRREHDRMVAELARVVEGILGFGLWSPQE